MKVEVFVTLFTLVRPTSFTCTLLNNHRLVEYCLALKMRAVIAIVLGALSWMAAVEGFRISSPGHLLTKLHGGASGSPSLSPSVDAMPEAFKAKLGGNHEIRRRMEALLRKSQVSR